MRPKASDAERMVVDLGRRFGLKVALPSRPRASPKLAATTRRSSRRSCRSSRFTWALAPETPRELEHDAIDAVGADNAEGDFLRFADLALRARSMNSR